jgi:polysaccharide export outer membrane protein
MSGFISANLQRRCSSYSLGLSTLFFALLLSTYALAQDEDGTIKAGMIDESGTYQINAGDVLSLEVWNEPSLSSEQFSVRPDGFVSIPVIGEIRASKKTILELQASIAEGLSRYLKDEPTVVVSVLASNGNLVYVLGKVGRPGAFPLNGPMDVTQALAFAGGLNSFAAENKIKVLRRDNSGQQRSIKFKYGQVKDGDKLETNILLKSGDVVLVP